MQHLRVRRRALLAVAFMTASFTPPASAQVCEVSAYADGFAPTYGEVQVKAGIDTVKRFALLLEAAASGSVVTANDSPVSAATVYIGYGSSVPGAGPLEQFVTGHVVTDDAGAFILRGLVPDTAVALQAELDGRLSDIVTVSSITPGVEQQGIVLRMQ